MRAKNKLRHPVGHEVGTIAEGSCYGEGSCCGAGGPCVARHKSVVFCGQLLDGLQLMLKRDAASSLESGALLFEHAVGHCAQACDALRKRPIPHDVSRH